MTDAPDPRTVPGAMEHVKRRELPDGSVIEFESASAGWLTKKGEPRRKDWRAYYFTPSDGKRVRYPSTSTVLDALFPKDGLAPWSEARGIEGAIEAVRLGLIDPTDPASAAMAVGIVRSEKLGADRARDEAADRGINIHRLLEVYMETGSPPNPSDHPLDHYGYIRALTRFLLAYDPEPLAVEQLVVHPELGYAGRLDLIARAAGRRVLFDAKTSEKCAVYERAHYQGLMYSLADVACGGEPVDAVEIAVFAANGEFRVMECAASEAKVLAALRHWQESKPVVSVCEAANRVEREARRAA